MNIDGVFDVRNGGSYESISTVPYSADTIYHVKMLTNLDTCRYDVYVTPEGDSETKIAENYAFRIDAPEIRDLGWITLKSGSDDQYKIENHTIVAEGDSTPTPTTTATPTVEPTGTPTPESTATPTPESTATPEYTATATPTSTPEPTATPTPESTPSVIIIDNTDAECTFDSTWDTNTSISGYYGSDYAHDGSVYSDESKWAKWTPDITTAGDYNIYMNWTSNENRPDAAPLEIAYNGGTDTSKTVDQQINGGTWQFIGTYNLAAGTGNYVKLMGTDSGYTIADAVKFEFSSSQ